MSIEFIELNISGENLLLSAGRALIWPSQELIIIADLHLGKTALFRQHGMPIPSSVQENDLENISKLLAQFPSKKLIVVGDMFHQNYNEDINSFINWRNSFDALEIILVEGNHDKLPAQHYQHLGITTSKPHLDIAPFRFVHKPPVKSVENLITISGHLHPGVRLIGKARQGMRLPCFTVTESGMVLPAFSLFTGLQISEVVKGCQYYAIAGNKIMKV